MLYRCSHLELSLHSASRSSTADEVGATGIPSLGALSLRLYKIVGLGLRFPEQGRTPLSDGAIDLQWGRHSQQTDGVYVHTPAPAEVHPLQQGARISAPHYQVPAVHTT